jgi:hypothetical protein
MSGTILVTNTNVPSIVQQAFRNPGMFSDSNVNIENKWLMVSAKSVYYDGKLVVENATDQEEIINWSEVPLGIKLELMGARGVISKTVNGKSLLYNEYLNLIIYDGKRVDVNA